MFKKLLLGLLLLALIAGAAIYFVLSGGLNQQIKNGVETYGPQVTQTPVTLENVNLSILSGSGSLTGLNVGNPDGFKSANIFSLGQIDLKVDTSTVFSDKIIIDHIIIKQPEISYEKTLTSSNLKELLENIEEFTGPADTTDTTADPAEDTGAKKQVVIKQLIIEDGTVYVGVMGIGQTVSLPRIEMADIGESGKQMTMAEVLDLVLSKVLQSIGPAIANAGDLGSAAVDALKTQGLEKVDQASEKVGKSIKGLFGK
ncbi:hypothetical protein SH580_09025 [Coraliomargarita algicola]|uniref:AsmA domain-containing protein n=1 Tax=Coraliomargarita algicola TaxID=3092156 RepID=A0ABZ0RSH4_9BACT|nr:hypothetical protein [Coraliomargarita sp. J2-16]WPJ97852.1 hypothetical protein SH580_09025 [Coraliomargarita sp. J2-16]